MTSPLTHALFRNVSLNFQIFIEFTRYFYDLHCGWPPAAGALGKRWGAECTLRDALRLCHASWGPRSLCAWFEFALFQLVSCLNSHVTSRPSVSLVFSNLFLLPADFRVSSLAVEHVFLLRITSLLFSPFCHLTLSPALTLVSESWEEYRLWNPTWI